MAKQTRLREYTESMIEAPLEHLAEGLITADQLSYVFSAAALLVFLKANNMKNIPQKETAQEVVTIDKDN